VNQTVFDDGAVGCVVKVGVWILLRNSRCRSICYTDKFSLLSFTGATLTT